MNKSFLNKKPCNSNSPKASDGKHVCNEKTGNWVTKTGKIGKEILNGKSPKKKNGCDPNSPKANSGKHVCNEKTGNWILAPKKNTIGNVVGKKGCDSKSPKASDGKHVCNENTGKWVIKTGKIGKEILKLQANVSKSKSPKPKSPKPKSPKSKSLKLKSPKSKSPKPKSLKPKSLKGMTTKNLTIKDNVTFTFKACELYDEKYVNNVFKNIFKVYTINASENGDFDISVSGEQIVKLTNDDIAQFIMKFQYLKDGKYKITTKSNNPQINVIVAKLNSSSMLDAYIPNNDLEALNIIIEFSKPIIIGYSKPINKTKLKSIFANNPFTKNSTLIGPVNDTISDSTAYIVSVSPDENKHDENMENLKELEKDIRKDMGYYGVKIHLRILSKKKNIYAKIMKKIYSTDWVPAWPP